MTKPNQDPLDDPILGSILRRFGRRVLTHDVSEPYAFEDAVKRLLKWRSDYVMGLLPSKCTEDVGVIARMGKSYSSRDQKDEQITANLHRNQGYNQCIDDIRAKNERGIDE